MRAQCDHALVIADHLGQLAQIHVLSERPQTPMMHLLFEKDPKALTRAAVALATDRGIWTGTEGFQSVLQDLSRLMRIEFAVGDATLEFQPQEVADIVAELAGRRTETPGLIDSGAPSR